MATRKAKAAKKVARTKLPGVRVKAKRTKTEPKPIRAFKSQTEFESWLEKNYDNTEGVWIRFAKKGSGIRSVTHPEALESALCYGWIDALRLPESDKTYLQRFLPRRPKSLWSQINREKAVSLTQSGRMRLSGHAEIERARQDGRWDKAYPSPAKAEMPAEFQRELERHPKAKAFFETINRVNRYAIIWRLATAKNEETRQKLSQKFIDMLEKGETLH